jgi:hypothetical protein
MDRNPFGNRGQYAPVPRTPSIVGGDRPRIQAPPRFRFAEWQRRGMLPPGLNPATLAKGYRWAHGGRSPYRDPERRACRAYSEVELRLALAALQRIPAPPPRPRPTPPAHRRLPTLSELWVAVLQRLPLPSTRMLLLQQTRLALLANGTALVEVVPNWLPLVRSRLQLLRAAFAAQLGYPVAVILRGVGQ